MHVSGNEGWQKGERAERCDPPAELFPEVTVKMTAGGSALVLRPSLSDKTLLSSQGDFSNSQYF